MGTGAILDSNSAEAVRGSHGLPHTSHKTKLRTARDFMRDNRTATVSHVGCNDDAQQQRSCRRIFAFGET
jgi:hypothetical protein